MRGYEGIHLARTASETIVRAKSGCIRVLTVKMEF